MKTKIDTVRLWLEEAKEGRVLLGVTARRYLWIWPLQVENGGTVGCCESVAIWNGGIEFRVKRRVSVGAHLRLRRKLRDSEESIDVRVNRVWRDMHAGFGVEGRFDGGLMAAKCCQRGTIHPSSKKRRVMQ